MARHLSVDIESFSDIDIKKSGLYKYCSSPNFEVLLFAYSFDFGPVEIVDLANGEKLPQEVLDALHDDSVVKHAYNAPFEISCLNAAGFTTPAEQWRCTMLHGLYLGYPAGLAALGNAVGLPEDKKKFGIGLALIRYFCVPCKPTKSNGNRCRNYPRHDTAKWELFKSYCRQDVASEMEIYKRLASFEVPDEVQRDWLIDYALNSRGIKLDMELVDGALAIDAEYKELLTEKAVKLTGLSNPNSRSQLLDWINENTELELEDLKKGTVAEQLSITTDEKAKELLEIRRELSKSSVSKYAAMQNAVCSDGRVRGLLQFYGANRTGRWAGRLVQVQNLPRNYIENLDTARYLVKSHNRRGLNLLYGDVADTLSQLIRTAFVAPEGKTLCVSDFSAIEARVLAWLAGEQWRLEVFAGHGKIYEASASQMFGVPIEKIKKGEPEYALRQKGKVAELACIAEGQLVITDAGLVPIEQVTTEMKVFDGECFVHHDGVVYKGEREVITYDGLTATKDHLVWVEGKHEPIQFGCAAACGSHLRKPSTSWDGVWQCENNFSGTALHKRMVRSFRSNRVSRLWKNRMDSFCKFEAGQVKRLPALQSAKTDTEMARPQIYCGETTLHESEGQKLQELRGKRNPLLLRLCSGRGCLDDRTLRTSGQGYGIRSYRCKRKLRTRKLALGNASRELPKSAKVYDILNCGPNSRFVVSGCLVHNCGYQGGVGALKAMGADDMGLSDEQLTEIIRCWRNSNRAITAFWYQMEQAVIEVMQTAQPQVVARGMVVARECNAVYGNDFLTVKLPSGRKLYYPHPYLQENKFGKMAVHYKAVGENNKWGVNSTYGGKMVENITQAVARDCLALALRRLVEAGYVPLMHIHDEVVLEVPKTELHEDELERINAIMCEPIPWAPGLKLNAAGFISDYYMKD